MIQSTLSPIVQKYGGSSLSSIEKVQGVAEKVIASRASGRPVVVVVSAMGDTTSQLIERARALTDSPPRRELDMLLSSGERMSTALLAMALEEAGAPAISLTGPQAGIRTDENHSSAEIVSVDPERVLAELAEGRIVIVAGFQGQSPSGEVTTLGRGGSDTTAVAIAGAIGAERCEIYSDVAGVFTADPRLVEAPRRLETIGSGPMSEYALHGARVLHPRCLAHAHEAGVTILACSTFKDGPNTEIRPGADLVFDRTVDGSDRILGVTSRKRRAQVIAPSDRVESVVETIAAVLGDVDGLLRETKGETDSLLVDLEDVPDPEHTVARLREELGEAAEVRAGLASVTAVAPARDAADLEAAAREALRSADVTVNRAFTGAASVTFAIPSDAREDAVRVLHAALVEASSKVGV